jgi:hypothetical protein
VDRTSRPVVIRLTSSQEPRPMSEGESEGESRTRAHIRLVPKTNVDAAIFVKQGANADKKMAISSAMLRICEEARHEEPPIRG